MELPNENELGTRAECGQPDGENACPQCGGALADIRGAQSGTDAAEGAEWGCRGDSCGARGRYDERGKPVANDPDSARLDGVYGRLIDAMAASSDRLRVRYLADRYALLRIMERDNDWLEDEGGAMLWCQRYKYFEDEMRAADDDLACEDFSDFDRGSHLVCCGP